MESVIVLADSMNRHYVPMLSDSSLIAATQFYKHHGSHNEQLKAYYLLGCVYRDLGEAPKAIENYHKAIVAADTTSTHCDFRTLGCVYAQMADVYRQVLLLSNETECRKQSHRYGLMAGDTLGAISSIDLLSGVYAIRGIKDSAEMLAMEAIRLYQEHGYSRQALEASFTLMHLYMDMPDKQSELKRIIRTFDTEHPFFDQHHELPPTKRMFYFYKGRYYDNNGELDSAEYYYRKIAHDNMVFQEKDPMYRGLLSVFKKRHLSDSIAKYAQLFCEANDSSIAIKDRELTARLAASYHYNTIQRDALEHEQEASRAHLALLVIAVFVLLATAISVFSWLRYKERKQHEIDMFKKKYADSVDTYQRNLDTLRIIDDSRRATIEEMHRSFANIEKELREENEQLKANISDFSKRSNIKDAIKHAQNYISTPIVQRIYSLAKTPLKELSKSDLNELLRTTGEYFPAFIQKLKSSDSITQQALYVAILVCLHLHSNDISNLLGMSSQQVTNLKRTVNTILFQDPSARTLYSNIVQSYEIYIG